MSFLLRGIVIQSGQHITERLKRVLKDLEKEELENTMIRLEQQQITTHHLTRTISWIAIIACVLVVFFVVLIINDITQSQRYRRELEAAKTYTERLLHNREKLMLTVTHDIKSPLSSIIGYIELLNNTQLEERQHYLKHEGQPNISCILPTTCLISPNWNPIKWRSTRSHITRDACYRRRRIVSFP